MLNRFCHRKTYNRRVHLQHNRATGHTGDQDPDFETLATFRVNKRDLAGRELFAARQDNAEVSTVWTARYRTDVKNEHFLLCGALRFEVLWVQEAPAGDRSEILIYTKASRSVEPAVAAR